VSTRISCGLSERVQKGHFATALMAAGLPRFAAAGGSTRLNLKMSPKMEQSARPDRFAVDSSPRRRRD